jgi:prepilin-type N-terminal cleavage/methylation domain-containing protein
LVKPSAISFQLSAGVTGDTRALAGTRPSKIQNPRSKIAFTLIELLVVLAVIGLVLALAMPALTSMNTEARLTNAVQTIKGQVTRAYFNGVADGTLTAVRFMPAQWDDGDKGKTGAVGKQRMVLYRWTSTTIDANDPLAQRVGFDEYFTRVPNAPAVDLPDDVWVAPLEALSNEPATLKPDPELLGGSFGAPQPWTYPSPPGFGAGFVLDGTVGKFRYDANRCNRPEMDGADFLNADDFMLVFEPKAGLRTGTPQAYRMQAYAAPDIVQNRYESISDPTYAASPPRSYRRYGFSGLVIYPRSQLTVLGPTATGGLRKQTLDDLLKRGDARPYLVQRFGGGLLYGGAQP